MLSLDGDGIQASKKAELGMRNMLHVLRGGCYYYYVVHCHDDTPRSHLDLRRPLAPVSLFQHSSRSVYTYIKASYQ